MKTEEMQKLLICLVVFISIINTYHFLRFRMDNGILSYDEYKYIRKAQNIITENFSTDSLKSNLQDPVSIFLAVTKEYKEYMNLLPYVFIVINLFLVYALAIKTQISEKHKIFSLIYLLFSPLFIYIHTTFNIVFICMSLILAGILLFINNKPLIGLIIFLFAIWINPWAFFVISAFLLFIFQKLKETTKNFEIIALLFIVAIFLILKGFSLPTIDNLLQISKTYITDIGSTYGLGIFGIISAIIGMIIYLRNKENNRAPILFFILLSFFSIYDKFFLVFLEIMAAYFSGFAMFKIVYGNWESEILKNYVTLLIICGLLFSAGSYLNKSYKAGANYNERISVDWLKNQVSEDSIILSYYEFGYLLSTTNSNSFTDNDYYLNSKEKSKITESNDIFMSRDLKKCIAFLKKNNIEYIWINRAMKETLVWNKDDQGMLFIMQNSISFKKVYKYEDVEIWKYVNNP